jgi:hypothetical protein
MGGGGGEGGGGVKEAEQREARFNLRTEDAGISLLQLRGGAKGGGLLECPPPAPRNLSHIERRARLKPGVLMRPQRDGGGRRRRGGVH